MSIYTETIFETHTETEKAKAAYQEAITKCLAGQITLDECLNYQKAVFEACNSNTEPFKLKDKKK